jgi:hypothetical protein
VNVPASEQRKLLVLRIDGPLDAEREAALTGLIASELGSTGVTLSVERSELPRLRWTETARADPRALVIAILDVRATAAWALYVVDAARGRAILRRLPGGVEQNAAALEGVSAILTSATAAVREGLEVASSPLEAVVGEGEVQPVARAVEPREPAPAAEPIRIETSADRQSGPSLFMGVFARGASLAPAPVPGLAGEIGARLPLGLSVTLEGAYDFPARMATELGAFELQRSLVGLKLGRVFSLGWLALEPRAGSGAELVHRMDATANAGFVGGDDRRHARFALELGLLARTPLVGDALALALGVDGSYAPRPLRFTEAGGRVIERLPSWSVAARLGAVLAVR